MKGTNMAATKKVPKLKPMTVSNWPIDDVKPYEGNPRTITDLAVKKVADSIQEYGWRQPIVVDKQGVIIVGHTRMMAAKLLGLTDVPVHVAADMKPAQVRAYRIVDNRVGEETEWDRDKLLAELGSLMEDLPDFDVTNLGFDETDLEFLGEDFLPVLNPQKAIGAVTSGDMDKADDKLKNGPKDGAKQDLIEVTCPHCGDTYALSRASLLS